MLVHVRALTADEVRGLDPRRLDGVGLAGDHLLNGDVRLRPAAEVREVGVAVRSAALFVDHLHDPLAVHILHLMRVVGILRQAEGGAGDDVAAGNVEVAGDAPEVGDRLRDRGALRAHVDGQTPLDGGGAVRGVSLRRLVDDILRDPCDLADLVERILLRALGELVEAVAPLFHELVVIPVVFDDEVDHAERQRRVRAGADLEKMLGVGGEVGPARVDADDFTAALHAVDDPCAHKAVRAADAGVLAPDDDILRHLPARIVVALFKHLGAVGDAGVAVDHAHSSEARGVAGLAREAKLAPVRAAVSIAEVRDRTADIAPGALHEDDGLRSEIALELLELFLDDVERLVPCDALEFAAAALADALHRVKEAVLVVKILRHCEQTRAAAPLVPRMAGVALDLDDLAVLDVDFCAAAAVAAGTGRPYCGIYDLVVFFIQIRHWFLLSFVPSCFLRSSRPEFLPRAFC